VHIVVLGEGLSPVFVARWLRRLSSTVDITILSQRGKLGYSINLLPLYAVGGLVAREITPISLDYVKNVLRTNVIFENYKINLKEKIVLLNNEKLEFDYLILALNPKPVPPAYAPISKAKCPWYINDARDIRNLIDNVSKVMLTGDFLTSITLYELLTKLGYKCRIFIDEHSTYYLDNDLYRLIIGSIEDSAISEDLEELREADLVLYGGYWCLPDLLTNLKLKTGKFGIMIGETCLSSNKFIYVIGGCAEHIISYGVRYLPLSEGLHDVESLIVATNVLSLRRALRLRKALGSLYCKCNNCTILTLGSTVKEAQLADVPSTSVRLRGREPMEDVVVKIVIDRRSMSVIGVHMISSRNLDPTAIGYVHLVGYLGLTVSDLISTAPPSSLGSVTMVDPLLDALRSSWYKLLWLS